MPLLTVLKPLSQKVIGQLIEVDMLCVRLARYHLCVLLLCFGRFYMHAHGHFGQWLMKCQMPITYSKLSRHFHISFNMTNDWDQMIKTNFVAIATAFTQGPLLCPNFLSTNRRLIYPIKHSHQNRNFFFSSDACHRSRANKIIQSKSDSVMRWTRIFSENSRQLLSYLMQDSHRKIFHSFLRRIVAILANQTPKAFFLKKRGRKLCE